MKKNYFIDKCRNMYPDVRWVKGLMAGLRMKWKARSLLPAQVTVRAEQDPAEKSGALELCRKRWPKIYRITRKKADRILTAAPCYQDRADKDALGTDMLFCRFAYGFMPDEYLCYELEGKTIDQRRAFISDIDRYRCVFTLNDIKDLQIFNNKIRTYERFGKYYGREAIGIRSQEDFETFRQFVAAHPVFVRKMALESMGRSVERMNFSACGMTEREFFDSIIKDGQQILEELVIQHPVTAALHPSSVNTIRCITILTRHGVEVAYTFMKVGQNGKFVDNGGAGGILVGIDKETGMLNTDGFDEFNTRYVTHPNTGIPFRGYQLPRWNEALAICKEMAAQIPSVQYIGWDLAVTEQGWIVIEGNSMSQLIGPQTVWKVGIKAEMERYLEDAVHMM